MQKRIIVAVAVLVVILAAVPARAIVVCDGRGIEYDIRVANGEFLFGTARNLPCVGSAPFVGSFTRVQEGYFFSIFVDQNPLNPDCCEGFEIIGVWSAGSGSGNWYESREEFDCTNTGTFTISRRCNAAPLRTDHRLEMPGLSLPGLKN